MPTLDPTLQHLAVWALGILSTLCLALITHIWRRMERQYDGLTQRYQALKGDMHQRETAISARFETHQERRVALQERLAILETGQENILGWLKRIAEQLDRLYAREMDKPHGGD